MSSPGEEVHYLPLGNDREEFCPITLKSPLKGVGRRNLWGRGSDYSD
jgi:hypothetical protein